MKLFTPQLTEDDFLDLFPSPFPSDIQSSSLLERVASLTDTAESEVNEFGDRIWQDFYLPLRRKRRIIALPVSIGWYGGGHLLLSDESPPPYMKDATISINSLRPSVYHHRLLFNFGSRRSFGLLPGEEQPKPEYFTILEDIAKLVPFLQQDHSLPEKLVPYDLRTGTIQGKYVLEEVMPQEEKQRILKKYKEHLRKNLDVKEISLDDYLATAALCYQAAFGKETEVLSPLEMYRRWADGRHGGMLELKSSSKRAFMRWRESTAWSGTHPFEILFSGHNYGIHLTPPERWSERDFYSLSVGTTGYAEVYLAMLDALIEKKVPVHSERLEEVLTYLAGESVFRVNGFLGEKSFHYFPSAKNKRKYFPHITWDALKMPKWKKEGK